MNDKPTIFDPRLDLPGSVLDLAGRGRSLSRLLAVAALVCSAGCAGSDPTGPSDPVLPALSVTTASLPDAAVDVAYGSQTLEAAGGDGRYSWSLVSGQQPDGLGLAPNGVITGTPTALETRHFTVQVTSGDGQTAQRALSITVAAPPTLQPDELCSHHPAHARATFEDANLEAAVRSALSVETHEELTCAMLASLERLDAAGRGVASLVGVQNLTGLWELEVSNNAITDLSALSGLTDLTDLGLFNNTITDISALTALTDLWYLNLNGNAIGDLSALSGLTELEILFLGNNAITDIGPLSGLTDVWNLSLAGNPITDISALGGLTRLTDLRLGSTSVTDHGPLGALTRLEYLDLSDNAIEDVAVLGGLLSAHANLWHLGLSDNAVTDIGPLSALTRLTDLGLSKNAFTDISALSVLTGLTKLYLTDNAITDIGPLKGLSSLSYLGLSGNPDLDDIEPLLENPELGAGVAVTLLRTNVRCEDVAALRAKHVTVHASGCE